MKKFLTSCAVLLLAAPALLAQSNPDALYIVGNLNGWSTPVENTAIELTSANNNGIYTGTVDYDGGTTLEFKIFDAKTDNWDENSYGAESATPVELTPNVASSWNMVQGNAGKNFTIGNWGGTGTFTVDWSSKTVSVIVTTTQEETAPEMVYVPGNFNGWATSDSAYALNPQSPGSTVYTGSFTIPADLNDTDGNQFPSFKLMINGTWYGIGDCQVYSNQPYVGTISTDGNNIAITNWTVGKEGTIELSFDWSTKSLTVSSPTQPEYVFVMPTALYMAGTMNGWTADDSSYMLSGSNGVYTARFLNVTADGNLSFKFTDGTWDQNWGASGSYNESLDGVVFDLYGNVENVATLAETGANFVVSNWVNGGMMEVTVDLNNLSVTIAASGQPNKTVDQLYLVGDFNNWGTPDSADFSGIVLTNNGSGVFNGTINYEGTSLEFKVFEAATSNWDNDSYGATSNDGVTLYPDEEYTWDMVKNGSNFHITNWGGTGSISIDLNSNTLTVVVTEVAPEIPFEAPEQIYLIGACQGWDINSDVMTLELEGEATYTGTFEIPQGDFMLRFYTQLGDWNATNASVGSQSGDDPIEITFSNDSYSGDCVFGKGSWSYPEWEGGPVTFFVDLNNMTVKFTNTLSGVEINPIQTVENFNVYNMQGVKVLNTNDANSLSNLKGMYIINGKKVVLK